MTRAVFLILAALLSPVICFGDDPSLGLHFAGGVGLFHKVDTFADELQCELYTNREEYLPYLEITRPDRATVNILHGQKHVAREPAPQLKIGDAPPTTLALGPIPFSMVIPKSEAKVLTSGFHENRRIQVRWYELPYIHERTHQIDLGDIETGYRVADTLCQWKSVQKVDVKVNKTITRLPNGGLRVLFTNRWGWQVIANKEWGCHLVGAERIALTFREVEGQSSVHPSQNGGFVAFDREMKVVGTIPASTFALDSFLSAVTRAGEQGYLLLIPGRIVVPLTGIFQAIDYGQKDCLKEFPVPSEE